MTYLSLFTRKKRKLVTKQVPLNNWNLWHFWKSQKLTSLLLKIRRSTKYYFYENIFGGIIFELVREETNSNFLKLFSFKIANRVLWWFGGKPAANDIPWLWYVGFNLLFTNVYPISRVAGLLGISELKNFWDKQKKKSFCLHQNTKTIWATYFGLQKSQFRKNSKYYFIIIPENVDRHAKPAWTQKR
jgi:hypothetical protein